MSLRNLTPNEKMVAYSVFGSSINYDDVYIANYFLPGNHGVAVTIMRDEQSPVGGIHKRYWFTIFWGADVYNNGADSTVNLSNTLIHELTHVWQGQHGLPFMYMVDSMIAQGKAIIWHWDRNKAYEYDHNNYQKWSDYNVEQQGNIVEDWYRKDDGNQSASDPRFVYIKEVIRVGKPNAPDIPSIGVQAGAGIAGSVGTKSGYSHFLKIINAL